MRVKTTAFSWGKCRVLNPELEFAIGAYGGYEVRVDSWRKPMNLIVLVWRFVLIIAYKFILQVFQRYALPKCRIDSRSRLYVGCKPLSFHLPSWRRSGRRNCWRRQLLPYLGGHVEEVWTLLVLCLFVTLPSLVTLFLSCGQLYSPLVDIESRLRSKNLANG